MSSFHCPIGAKSYNGEGCIDCKMCIAQSFTDFREASAVMRKHIESTNSQRDMRPISKICVCGKGGVGKSTLTAIIAQLFSNKGYRVLVLDTDESNPSLYRKLGLAREPKSLLSYLERFSMQYGIPEGTWISNDEILFDDIPDEFLVTEGNISLMEIGKIDDPFQGCACSMADLSRQLMRNLALREKELVITDLEAGVESFGRGIEQGADTIITVAEPSFDSLELTKKIKSMANGLGIRRVYTIFNKITDISTLSLMEEATAEEKICVLGSLEIHKDISEVSIMGLPLKQDSAVFSHIGKMVDTILL